MPPDRVQHSRRRRKRAIWHDVTGHHRYYGSSAINGGERIVEDRRRPRLGNLCGF